MAKQKAMPERKPTPTTGTQVALVHSERAAVSLPEVSGQRDPQVIARQLARKKRQDHVMTLVCQGGAVFAVLLLIGFIGCVWVNGFRDMTLKMLSFGPEGMGSMLFNTLYIVVLALVFSFITGLPAGVYLAEYAKQGKLTRWVRMAIETLASLPSIVVGLFGYLAFIVMTHSQWNLLAGALAVSVITLPFVTSVTEDALRNLPEGYRQGSLGLGASHWQTIWRVLVPACLPRIMTGMVMAAGRGFGEAAALMFTAGMSTDIDWSDWNVLSSRLRFEPLPSRARPWPCISGPCAPRRCRRMRRSRQERPARCWFYS
jgi:phosphate transport system permease protein